MAAGDVTAGGIPGVTVGRERVAVTAGMEGVFDGVASAGEGGTCVSVGRITGVGVALPRRERLHPENGRNKQSTSKIRKVFLMARSFR